MARFYDDVEGEWRDDGIDRFQQMGEPGPEEAIARRATPSARLKMGRIVPLAIFLAGVLVGKAL